MELQLADVTLSYSLVAPENPRAVLIIVHGLSEHGGRYFKLQRELAEVDFAVFAYDQRGFGKSTGRRTDVAHYTDFLDDLKAMIVVARNTHPKIPLFLIGHSLGGLVVSAFCIHFPNGVDGIILSAPAYEFFPLPWIIHFMGVVLNFVCPTIHIRYPSNPEKLSHDPEMTTAFRADPLIQSSGTPRFYYALRKMNDMVKRRADQIALPVLILQGTGDTIVVPEGAQRLYDKIKSEKKRLIFYDRFYHEPFNEMGRERVVADLFSWLNDLLQNKGDKICQ
ncbi:MAG: lysophospholipase [Nitrospirae bacterium]|nr:lysophospholipase [Candidatus Troglogloeales bacterium]